MTHAYPLDAAHPGTLADAKALVGGKAANLGVMSRDLGLPVPPGFVITTATCRTFLATGWPAGLDEELREQMAGVEAAVGRRFGDPSDPLLVSVRSGAPISMPGMMDTILNLGLNQATTDGLGRTAGDPAFAQACRERFEASFRSIVGVDDVPSDPWLQLRAAIEAVFRSWNSERARTYRAKEGIPDDFGTAVTVQAMVFGNRSRASGTGVVFTRNPATGEAALYGDVMFDAQGEDVVAGTHATEPIIVLDERLPAVAAELREHATRLEHHYADMCDIEFTIEDGRLWMLQTRVGKRSPQAAVRIAVDMAEDPAFPLTRAEAVERVRALLVSPPTSATARSNLLLPLVVGLPASPGVASGPIALTPEAAQAGADAGHATILVRAETSRGPPASSPHAAGSRAMPRSWRVAGASRRSWARRPWTCTMDRSSWATRSSRRATSSPSMAHPARCSRARSPARPRSCPRRGPSSCGRRSSGSRSAMLQPRAAPRLRPTRPWHPSQVARLRRTTVSA